MTDLTRFLFPAPAERRPSAIIRWWEKRRLAYNLFVGASGVVTLGVFSFVSFAFGDPIFPQVLIGAGIYGVLANLCYFLGPTAEILLHKVWGDQVLPTGPALYRMGLTFSVGLTLLPSLILIILSVARFVAGMFGFA